MMSSKIFLTILLFCFYIGITSASSLGKKQNPQVVPIAVSNIELSYSNPWWLNDTASSVCDSLMTVSSKISSNNVPFDNLNFQFTGGQGSKACFTHADQRLSLKLISVSQVFEISPIELCGSFSDLSPLKDVYHKEITNGISCHCPGGIDDYKFSKCNSTGLNFNTDPFQASICHNIVSRGNSNGCFIDKDATTDYSLKMSSNWNFFPIVHIKKRPMIEVMFSLSQDIATCDLNGVCTESISDLGTFNVSTLTAQLFRYDTGVSYTATISYENIKPLKDLLTDYYLVSSENNFTNPDSLFLIDKDKFNSKPSEFSYGYCPIRVQNSGELIYNAWFINQAVKNSFSASNCHPASGDFHMPFYSLRELFTTGNMLSSRLNLENVDFKPNGENVIKIRTQASISINFAVTPASPTPITLTRDISLMSSFQIHCKPSINSEGYPCVASIKTNSPTKVSIDMLDINQVLFAVDVTPEVSDFKFFIPKAFNTSNRTSVCARALNSICVVVYLFDEISHPKQYNDLITFDYNTQGGGNIFQDGEGNLHTWIIIIIVIGSILMSLLIIRLMFPVFLFIYKVILIVVRSIRAKYIYLKNRMVTIVNEKEMSQIIKIDPPMSLESKKFFNELVL